MADGKPDLPEDLLPLKPSVRSWTGKVETLGGQDEKVDEPKDQMASESSIPLSPQWLYAKPSETKMDSRGPPSVSLGNPPDPMQKEAWRLDGSQDKKDWRRTVTENESVRRWREEERETGLLTGRRDRRKGERRVENVSSRETTDSRTMSSSDRWHDGTNRNPGLESRRDNKWSSRWGPEEKEKESHTSEKRTDTEKEKDDAHSENQSFVSSNRPMSDRDPDSSRDKWRPRHRMEGHSGGSTISRSAPGFGLERGKVESHNLGFTVGRGRGRSSSASPIGAVHPLKDENVPGEPKFAAATLCYPRGKLLNIYRRQKLDDAAIAAIPDQMEEVPPITQVDLMEPLAFVAPDAEEEEILKDIWKGKVTSSGVVYNSFRQGRTSEIVSEPWDSESTETKQGTVGHILTGENVDASQEAADGDTIKAQNVGSSSNNEVCLNMEAGKEVTNEEEFKASSAALEYNPDDGVENATSFDIKLKLPDDSNSLFLFASSNQNHDSNGQPLESNREAKNLGPAPEELSLFYIDPQGNTQGPFFGADILSWFKQGFFGTDLLVRLADSPEGTPFRELGEIMPHLKVQDRHADIDDLNSILEQSGSLGGNLEVMHTSGLFVKSIDPSSEKLFQASTQFNGLSAQHVRSRISKPETNLQLQLSEGQSFEDFVAPDEEIVFPGRSGNAYSIAKSSRSIHSPMINSSSHPSLPNELTETNIPNENDNKLHRFGLLWSELEGAQTKHTQSSNMLSGVGRSDPFSAIVDPGIAGETWSDIYGKRTFPDSNIYQDALAAAHMPHVEHESNHFDPTERLMSQQLQQQQLNQQNMFTPHARLNESLLDHLPGQNLIHQQQLSKHSVPDLEHILALQMQQQRQLQLQQQFHQEQKILQERQQSQVQQAFFEQILRGQMPIPGLGESHAASIRSGNVLDQVLLEHQLLQELQQSHHASRHFVPPLEQLVQAKFGQAPLEENQRDLLELISHAQRGQVHSLEHQFLQQEQLQRQLSMGLKQHIEERDLDPMWPADQTNQFLRNSTSINRVHSSGFSPLDLYQQPQRPSHEEQLSHLERNLSLQEQLRQGLYDSSSPFERSMSLPVGATGINVNVANAMTHARGLDVDEPSIRLQSAGQVGTFSSDLRAHNPHHLVPNQYNASKHAIEGHHWVESDGQMGNDWIESQIQQLHMDRQERDMGVKMPSSNSSSWMSDGLSDDKSRQLLMELLHQKSGNQTTKSLERASSRIYSASNSLDHPFNVLSEQEAGLNNSIPVDSYGSSSSEPRQIYLADEPTGSLESDERLQFRPGSGVISEGERFLSLISDKSQGMMKGMAFEVHDGTIKQGGMTSTGERDISLSRHSSLGAAGGNASPYSDQIGFINSYVEDVAKAQVPTKSQDNMLLRRPPVHAPSQEVLLDFVSDQTGRGKTSLSGNDGGKRDTGGNIGQGSDTMPKKEIRFRRTSSFGEGDVSDASFIDMLKSNSKKSAAPEAHATTGADSSDGTQGGRTSKKKGKKGRQIDPALLGFKVTSNRILMGEIQRVED